MGHPKFWHYLFKAFVLLAISLTRSYAQTEQQKLGRPDSQKEIPDEFNRRFNRFQTEQQKLAHLESPKITLYEFNCRVERAISLLGTKKLRAISDSDHINIMMCANTMLVTDKKNSLRRRFAGGAYSKFQHLLKVRQYDRKIWHVYPNSTFNRGLGYYFPKLKMEYGGTPSPYSVFNVSD